MVVLRAFRIDGISKVARLTPTTMTAIKSMVMMGMREFERIGRIDVGPLCLVTIVVPWVLEHVFSVHS